MTLAEIRVNLILLVIIVGVSGTLIYGRFLLDPPRGALLLPASVPAESAPGTDAPAGNGSSEIPPPAASPRTPAPAAAGPSPETPRVPAKKPETVEMVPSPVAKSPVPAATPSIPAAATPVPAAKPSSPAAKTPVPVVKPPVVTAAPVPAAAGAPPPERPAPVRKKGTLVFVFDDAGHNLAQLAPFLRLPFPCTIAVLPGLQYSGVAAQRIRAAGKEVILHQPMQALNLSIDPGPGAIRKGMGAEQIRTLVRKNLAEIGPVAGINNHEGSLITADRPSMDTLLDFVRDNGIYFLDSRTNAETVVPALAREKKMTIWERAVFLDNIQDRTLIIEAVNSGMKIAERKGAAVMIGHIWSNDLASILTEMYPELVSQGFSLSTIAEIAVSGDADE